MNTNPEQREPLSLNEAEQKLKKLKDLLIEAEEVERTGLYNGVSVSGAKEVFGKDVQDIQHEIEQAEDYIGEKGNS